jgi:hypothetical protein
MGEILFLPARQSSQPIVMHGFFADKDVLYFVW